MEQPPPLTPEELTTAQAANQQPIGEPQTAKIFGILHLVFAAMGALGIAWAVFTEVTGSAFPTFGPQTPEMAAQAEMQSHMQEKLMTMTVISNLLAIGVTILMVIAGIKLLKKKKDAIKSSNRYAQASIAVKVINLIMTFTIMLPVMKTFLAENSVAGPTGSIMLPAMIGGATIGISFSLIYPILALILLNRPATKDWFAKRPE